MQLVPVALAVALVVAVVVVTVAVVTLPLVLVVVAAAVEVPAEVATTLPPAVNAFFTALSYLEFANTKTGRQFEPLTTITSNTHRTPAMHPTTSHLQTTSIGSAFAE